MEYPRARINIIGQWVSIENEKSIALLDWGPPNGLRHYDGWRYIGAK